MIDYRLIDFIDGVHVWPQGDDRGLFTAAVELAWATNNTTVRLSGLQKYIADNWSVLNHGLARQWQNGRHPDIEALERFQNNPAINQHASNIGWRNRRR